MSLSALNTAIYSRLGGTATSAGTAVFFLQAPDNFPLPYVVWDYTADRDENETPNRTKNDVLFIQPQDPLTRRLTHFYTTSR